MATQRLNLPKVNRDGHIEDGLYSPDFYKYPTEDELLGVTWEEGLKAIEDFDWSAQSVDEQPGQDEARDQEGIKLHIQPRYGGVPDSLNHQITEDVLQGELQKDFAYEERQISTSVAQSSLSEHLEHEAWSPNSLFDSSSSAGYLEDLEEGFVKPSEGEMAEAEPVRAPLHLFLSLPQAQAGHTAPKPSDHSPSPLTDQAVQTTLSSPNHKLSSSACPTELAVSSSRLLIPSPRIEPSPVTEAPVTAMPSKMTSTTQAIAEKVIELDTKSLGKLVVYGDTNVAPEERLVSVSPEPEQVIKPELIVGKWKAVEGSSGTDAAHLLRTTAGRPTKVNQMITDSVVVDDSGHAQAQEELAHASPKDIPTASLRPNDDPVQLESATTGPDIHPDNEPAMTDTCDAPQEAPIDISIGERKSDAFTAAEGLVLLHAATKQELHPVEIIAKETNIKDTGYDIPEAKSVESSIEDEMQVSSSLPVAERSLPLQAKPIRFKGALWNECSVASLDRHAYSNTSAIETAPTESELSESKDSFTLEVQHSTTTWNHEFPLDSSTGTSAPSASVDFDIFHSPLSNGRLSLTSMPFGHRRSKSAMDQRLGTAKPLTKPYTISQGRPSYSPYASGASAHAFFQLASSTPKNSENPQNQRENEGFADRSSTRTSMDLLFSDITRNEVSSSVPSIPLEKQPRVGSKEMTPQPLLAGLEEAAAAATSSSSGYKSKSVSTTSDIMNNTPAADESPQWPGALLEAQLELPPSPFQALPTPNDLLREPHGAVSETSQRDEALEPANICSNITDEVSSFQRQLTHDSPTPSQLAETEETPEASSSSISSIFTSTKTHRIALEDGAPRSTLKRTQPPVAAKHLPDESSGSEHGALVGKKQKKGTHNKLSAGQAPTVTVSPVLVDEKFGAPQQESEHAPILKAIPKKRGQSATAKRANAANDSSIEEAPNTSEPENEQEKFVLIKASDTSPPSKALEPMTLASASKKRARSSAPKRAKNGKDNKNSAENYRSDEPSESEYEVPVAKKPKKTTLHKSTGFQAPRTTSKGKAAAGTTALTKRQQAAKAIKQVPKKKEIVNQENIDVEMEYEEEPEEAIAQPDTSADYPSVSTSADYPSVSTSATKQPSKARTTQQVDPAEINYGKRFGYGRPTTREETKAANARRSANASPVKGAPAQGQEVEEEEEQEEEGLLVDAEPVNSRAPTASAKGKGKAKAAPVAPKTAAKLRADPKASTLADADAAKTAAVGSSKAENNGPGKNKFGFVENRIGQGARKKKAADRDDAVEAPQTDVRQTRRASAAAAAEIDSNVAKRTRNARKK
ncbi:hypothetical protein N0V90_004314 [Kalmusia sp. IMI 367209]|nr:hypothetical protein N0V90_004314 [Kalmusia sp. IMI 367209]